MKRTFYVGGFLYTPKVDKVLLHQAEIPTSDEPFWEFFGGLSKRSETPQKALQRVIRQQARVNVPLKLMHFLYDYVNSDEQMQYHVFFINKTELKKDLSVKHTVARWFSLEDSHRLNLPVHTRQDLIFFERELNAKRNHLPTASL